MLLCAAVTLGVANETSFFVSWGTPSCYDIDEKLKCALDLELVFRQQLMKNRLLAKLMFLNWQQCASTVFVYCLL